MRLRIPLTGHLIADGKGDLEDPVRAINLNLGNLRWSAVSYDFDAGIMEVEAEVRKDPDESEEQYQRRRQLILDNAKHLLESHTIDELYQMSGSARLKKNMKSRGIVW